MTKKTPPNQKPPTNSSNDQAGFTLADVAIASAIFAGVLVVCLSAFIAMGRIYFKGSLETRTQNVALKILDEINRTISTTAVEVDGPITHPGSDWAAYCVAGIKYSFLEGKQLDLDPPPGSVNRVKRAFVKSVVTDAAGLPTEDCGSIGPDPPTTVEDGVELLGHRMRVAKFSITIYQRLHVIELDLVYGGDPDLSELENEVFEFPKEIRNDPTDPFDPTDPAHYTFDDPTDPARCELGETFCFITRNQRDIYQSVSE